MGHRGGAGDALVCRQDCGGVSSCGASSHQQCQVQRSGFGKYFKYYGMNSPISEKFPVAIRLNDTLNWVSGSAPYAAVPMAISDLLSLEPASHCNCTGLNCSSCYYVQVPVLQ